MSDIHQFHSVHNSLNRVSEVPLIEYNVHEFFRDSRKIKQCEQYKYNFQL